MIQKIIFSVPQRHNNNAPFYWALTPNIFLGKTLREVENWEGEGGNLQKQHASKLIPCKPLLASGKPLLGVNEMNSLGHLILFLEHLNALNALASKQTSKQSLHPRHCCLCGWNLYEISLPQGEKLNTTRTTLKLSEGYPFTGWESGQMHLIPKVALPPWRSHLWRITLNSTSHSLVSELESTSALTTLDQHKNVKFLPSLDKNLNAGWYLLNQYCKRVWLKGFSCFVSDIWKMMSKNGKKIDC